MDRIFVGRSEYVKGDRKFKWVKIKLICIGNRFNSKANVTQIFTRVICDGFGGFSG